MHIHYDSKILSFRKLQIFKFHLAVVLSYVNKTRKDWLKINNVYSSHPLDISNQQQYIKIEECCNARTMLVKVNHFTEGN